MVVIAALLGHEARNVPGEWRLDVQQVNFQPRVLSGLADDMLHGAARVFGTVNRDKYFRHGVLSVKGLRNQFIGRALLRKPGEVRADPRLETALVLDESGP